MSTWVSNSQASMRAGLIIQVPAQEMGPSCLFQKRKHDHSDKQDTPYRQIPLGRSLLTSAM